MAGEVADGASRWRGPPSARVWRWIRVLAGIALLAIGLWSLGPQLVFRVTREARINARVIPVHAPIEGQIIVAPPAPGTPLARGDIATVIANPALDRDATSNWSPSGRCSLRGSRQPTVSWPNSRIYVASSMSGSSGSASPIFSVRSCASAKHKPLWGSQRVSPPSGMTNLSGRETLARTAWRARRSPFRPARS